MNTNIKEYLNCSKSKNFNDILFDFIDKSGRKDSDVYKKGDIDRKLFSKIRCSSTYIPKRNVVIKLGLALNLNCTEFNSLLNSAGYSLSSNKFDKIISFCLENNIYDLNVVNNYLYTFCNAIL